MGPILKDTAMYRAPLRELRFVLEELLQSQALARYPGLGD
jgi:hypothetical protein